MSELSRTPSGQNNDGTSGTGRLRQDFNAWLMSLQSGNFSAAKTAFAALKQDFQKGLPAAARQSSN